VQAWTFTRPRLQSLGRLFFSFCTGFPQSPKKEQSPVSGDLRRNSPPQSTKRRLDKTSELAPLPAAKKRARSKVTDTQQPNRENEEQEQATKVYQRFLT
jgi:hypothetical protein